MKKSTRLFQLVLVITSGLIVGLVSFMLTVQIVAASGVQQDDQPAAETEAESSDSADHSVYTAQDCQECHLDVSKDWEPSPHAHAFDDPYFQQQWEGLGEPEECLSCHTTNFNPATGEYEVDGISCQACHGEVTDAHPPAPVPILADTEYCGSCHTTTLSEWHRTGHAAQGIGCNSCHDPHSQQNLFEDHDQLCINCHEDTMDHYLEGIHEENDIGCVDCHALVIPPDPIPDDGIVPTGHAFTITPATCVACHTDALHAGFSLPGFERSNANGTTTEVSNEEGGEESAEEAAVESTQLSPQQQIQALESALATRNISILFQGAVIGLVLGGSTAWIVANNVRSRRPQEEKEDNNEENENDET
jgi:predicted CXXCH cytochrome family protein